MGVSPMSFVRTAATRARCPYYISTLRPEAKRRQQEILQRGRLVQVEPQQAHVVLEFLDHGDECTARWLIARRESRQRKGPRGLLDLGKQTRAQPVRDPGLDGDLLVVFEVGWKFFLLLLP